MNGFIVMEQVIEQNFRDICGSKRKPSSVDDTPDSQSKRINLVNDEHISDEAASKSFSLIPVLSSEYERKMETELMYIGKITKKQEISRLVKELSQIWPLTNKSYLKRVRRLEGKETFEIILHPVSDAETEDSCSTVEKLEMVIGNSGININGLDDCVTKHHVPKFQPLTRSQYENSVKFWPVQFHEDKYIAKVLSDQLFSAEEKASMQKFMKSAVEVAKCGEVQVGAVIVNPADGKVIVMAHDQRHLHPIQHAVMLAVDLVARSQGGGAWTVDSPNMFYASDVEKTIGVSKKSNLPYLCTSYDLYVTREPCIMCAMALVHSRIRRVFIGVSTPWGALGTHYKLHVQSGLNHHYEVWKGLMKEECELLDTQNTKFCQSSCTS